jgi:hypothetical protein
MTIAIGKCCHTFQMAVKGNTTVEAAKLVVDEIIRHIGMTPIFEPSVYQYEGDIGIIYIQPIFESFVAYDAWPCHGGGYITVSSCREFYADAVMAVVEKHGFEILDSSLTTLGLTK